MNPGILTPPTQFATMPRGLLGRPTPVPMPHGMTWIHPEALDWRARAITNGGRVSSATLAAVSDFCLRIELAGIRDRFFRLNLFAGENLAAALTPLFRAENPTASVRGNAADTNNGPFVEADYAATGSNGGLIGNGTSKFLNTGLAANSMIATDVHFAISLRTSQTSVSADKTAIGAFSTTGALLYGLDIIRPSGNPVGAACFGTYQGGTAGWFGESSNGTPLSPGHLVASSTSTLAAMYRNGTQSGATTTNRLNYTLAHPLFVFANANGIGGNAAVNHTNARMGGYSIGLGMTALQAASYSNAMSAFNVALSRT